MLLSFRFLVFLCFCLLLFPILTLAQTDTPEPTILGPISVVTPGPTMTPSPAPPDPRTGVCAAPFQPGFAPHIIRPGDHLADLLIGMDLLSLTQIAALNCLDDPGALPVGAVIWLPQRTPFITAAPRDTTPGKDEARIRRFEASSAEVENQAGVFFEWDSEGTTAYFYVCDPDPRAACERPAGTQPVPLDYTTPEISGFQYAGSVRYRLEVVDGDAVAVDDVMVKVVCSQDWLGEASGERQPCPQQPAFYLAGAWQPFEGGVMLWFADTRQIWVMTEADNRVQVFADPYVEGNPDPTAVAPDELFTPIRGFGMIWDDLGGTDSGLGWATAPETGFQTARQAAGRVSYTTYIKGAVEEVIYAVTILPGESSGWWAKIALTQQ